MKLKEMFENYVPFNEQEEKDKETILKYMNTFDDVLTRKNEFAHLTSSAFVLNKNRDKILMIYHNIYDSWAWVGGHADGEDDLLGVALREANEETGVTKLKPISEDIFIIDTIPVLGHFKGGKYVSAHTHLSVAYIVEADEDELISIKEDENSGVEWVPIEEMVSKCTEPHMKPIYQKALDKMKEFLK